MGHDNRLLGHDNWPQSIVVFFCMDLLILDKDVAHHCIKIISEFNRIRVIVVDTY